MRNILFIALIFCALSSLGQRTYFFSHISKSEGLSNNAVRAIIQDSVGYIWVATSDGLNRYDGHRFKVFRNDSKDSLSLPGNAVESMCLDREGNLWCGGSGWNSVAMLPKGTLKFRIFKLSGDPVTSDTRDIDCDALGRIWIGTTKGIYVIEPGASVARSIEELKGKIEVPNGTGVLPGKSIFPMPDQSGLWILTNKGVNYWNASENRFYNHEYNPNKDTIFNIIGCRSLTVDHNQILWTGATFGETNWTWFGYSLKTKKIVFSSNRAPSDSNVQRNHFQSVTCGPDNLIWLGNNARKPLIFDPHTFEFDTTLARVYPGSLGNQTLRATCFDRDGNIWVGTEQGIFLATKERQKVRSQYLGDVETFQKPRIKSIYPIDTNEILIAANRCIYRWNPKEQVLDTIWPIIDGKKIEEDLRFVNRKDEDELWVVTFYGLYTYNLNTKTCTSTLVTLPEKWQKRLVINSMIQQVFSDMQGFNYICTAEGLYVFNPEKNFYRLFTPKNKFDRPPKISDYEPRKEGGFWFSSSDANQLFYVLEDPDSLYTLNLLTETPFIAATVYESEDKSLWLGSANDGLTHFSKKGDFIRRYSLEDGLHSNCVYKILSSQSGQMIVITSDGIARYNQDNDRFERIFSSFALSDYIHRDVGCLDMMGRIWSYSENIFYSIVPEEITNAGKHEVTITGVKVLNRDAEISRLNDLHYTENTLSFEFSSFEFNPEIQTRYLYQLAEINTEWTPLNNESSVTFTALPCGNYTLRVRSDQSDLHEYTELKFKINRPWYATWFFRIAVILLVLSGIALGVHLFIQSKIKAKEREFEKIRLVEKERMRIARDMHDDLGAGLTTIRMMSENLGKQKEDASLIHISDTAVDLVDRMRQIVWTLNEEQNTVEDLLYYLVAYSRDFLRKSNVQLSSNGVPESNAVLSSVIRRNVFLASKEILNNVVRHSSATSVIMNFTVSENKLEIVIKDNGKGFASEHENKYGNGLKNIRRRMDEIGGSVSLISNGGLEVKMTVYY